MFSDEGKQDSDPESNLRFGMMLAELWHDWFEAVSEVAYQTHRACELFIQKGAASDRQSGPFDFRSAPRDGATDSIDMTQLKQCLQSMDPMQAARVMHAVQMMEGMEAMLKRRKARAREAEKADW